MNLSLRMVCLTTVLIITAAGIKNTFFQTLSNIGNYYYISFMVIAGTLFVIYCSKLIGHELKARRSKPLLPVKNQVVNKREYYRIQYPSGRGPELVIDADDATSHKSLTFNVTDISESSLSFIGGFFNPKDTIIGEVRFRNGNKSKFAGTVVRKESDRTCIDLHCYIPATMLMQEQRHMLMREKQDNGPLPPVSKGLKRLTKRKLASLSAKGICKKGSS